MERFAPVSPIIAATEVFLEPDVEHDEKVTAAHFLDLELGHARAPVSPADWNHDPVKAPHDGFQRQFDGQVEVGRDQRAASLDDLPSISLESVRRVVQANSKEYLDEKIGESVQIPFQPRIADDVAAADEAA